MGRGRNVGARGWSLAIVAAVAAVACGGDDSGEDRGGDDSMDVADSTVPSPSTAPASAAGTPATSAGPGSASAAAFPRTIESALGTAEIGSAPERVVALGWTDMDIVVALGVDPIGIAEAPDMPNGMYPWMEQALEGHELPTRLNTLTAGIPLEQVAALDPDLILAVNQYVQDDYEQLAQLAPVVSYVDDPWGEDWRDHARQIARGLGLDDDLDALLAETDAAVATAAAEHPELDGATFTFSAYRDGNFDLIDRPDVPVVEFLAQLGATLPDELVDPESPYSRAVSMENVGDLEADIVIVWTPEPDAMAADPVFKTLPAAAEGRVVYIDDVLAQALNSPTALSIPYTLAELVPDLAAAAAAANAD